jgi:hypothetical protein
VLTGQNIFLLAIYFYFGGLPLSVNGIGDSLQEGPEKLNIFDQLTIE